MDSGQRIGVVLEISRADPVANRARFGALHTLRPMEGAFVAMMSPHIALGRQDQLVAALAGRHQRQRQRAATWCRLPLSDSSPSSMRPSSRSGRT